MRQISPTNGRTNERTNNAILGAGCHREVIKFGLHCQCQWHPRTHQQKAEAERHGCGISFTNFSPDLVSVSLSDFWTGFPNLLSDFSTFKGPLSSSLGRAVNEFQQYKVALISGSLRLFVRKSLEWWMIVDYGTGRCLI